VIREAVILVLDCTAYTMQSTDAAAVLSVGAVPPVKSHCEPYANVLLPVPSCVIQILPDCPAVWFDGLANVRLPPSVTEKLLLSAKSAVIVAPSVKTVISPRWPLVHV
jgi:hypothetical protein